MATDDALRECLDQWRQGQPLTAHDDRLLTAALDDRAALATALRQTVTPWLVFGVQGTCCRWCGALDPLSTGGQSHAADCPVAVLARHDAARGEG